MKRNEVEKLFERKSFENFHGKLKKRKDVKFSKF